jgi:hypothetical protein
MDYKLFINNRSENLEEIKRAIKDELNRLTVIDCLNSIHNNSSTPILLRRGSLHYSYPAVFTIKDDKGLRNVDLWVEESRSNYGQPTDAYALNGCMIMGGFVDRMIREKRTIHFITPIDQLITNDISSNDPENSHSVCYNLMEYLPSGEFETFEEYLQGYQPGNRSFNMGLICGLTQILYNLALMESEKFTHGDVSLKKIIINPHQSMRAMYTLQERVGYEIPSPVMTVLVDFQRGVQNTTSPHEDVVCFFKDLFSVMTDKPELAAMLFNKDQQLFRDIKTMIEGGEGFDEDIKGRCLPSIIFTRFADQFFTRKESSLPPFKCIVV